ncbi:MAG: hypothetical protein ACRC3H_20800 [Lachnospiraceae bacterium]
MRYERNTSIIAIILPLLLIFAMLSGCSSDNINPSSEVTDDSLEGNGNSTKSEDDVTSRDLEDKLDGLLENEYEALILSIEFDENTAYTSGLAIPVNVTIENTGEETIVYVLGSGSYFTPTALFADPESLQTVIPQDQLGSAAMDYITLELAPGEFLEFTLYLMAIEPCDDFDDYSYSLYEQGIYIADLSWDELSENYPELKAAESGNYECGIYFCYYVKGAGNSDAKTDTSEDSSTEINVINGATGYAKVLFNVTVTAE